jgi:hypothetical protein
VNNFSNRERSFGLHLLLFLKTSSMVLSLIIDFFNKKCRKGVVRRIWGAKAFNCNSLIPKGG